MNRILIVEDEPRLASFLERGLRASGYATKAIFEGRPALGLVGSDEFDLVILDLGLPDIDGLEVLRALRRERGRQLPVIVLSARDDPSDRVVGLDEGADDYVVKPFSLDELLARIRVRLRGESRPVESVLEAGGIRLDLRRRRVSAEGREVDLTAREFTMLEILLRHRGQVLSKEQLLSHVWGYDYDPGSNIVEVYVGYLRKKLGRDAIETARGMGYRLADD